MFADEASNRRPGDVFHHEIREPIVRRSGIEQARDVRMIETRKNVTLGRETMQNFIRIGAAFQDLDRDFFFKLSICPRREIDRTHSAASEFARHDIGADAPARRHGFVLPKRDRGVLGAILERIGRIGLKRLRFVHQRFCFCEQSGIIRATRLHQSGTRRGRVFLQCIGQDILQPMPAFRIDFRSGAGGRIAFHVIHIR